MAQQPGESQSVLVVDVDVLVRHVISDYLRTCGYVVVEAANTDEARIVLQDDKVLIEAVLCDADAPGSINAFQLRAWTAQHRRDLQLILAGSVDTAAKRAAELCEEGPQLRRPYDPQSVTEYIRRILGSRAAERLTKA